MWRMFSVLLPRAEDTERSEGDVACDVAGSERRTLGSISLLRVAVRTQLCLNFFIGKELALRANFRLNDILILCLC